MDNRRPIFDVFAQRIPFMIMVELRKTIKPIYSSVLARKVNSTYSNTIKTLKVLENAKLLEFNCKGKLIKTIHLTEKGSKVAEHMEKIKDLL